MGKIKITGVTDNPAAPIKWEYVPDTTRPGCSTGLDTKQ